MRVLFAIKRLHQAAGGAERVLATITGGLIARGHDVTIATFDTPGAPPFYRFDSSIALKQLGVGETAKPSSMAELLHRGIALRRLVISDRPDVAVGFLNSSFVPLALGLIGTRVPVIASEHISYTHYDDRMAERLLLWAMPAATQAITVPSALIRAGFPSFLGRTMVAISNPVASAVPPLATPGVCQDGSAVILAAGRFTEQKDFSTLIAAFARVGHAFPHWRLRIVGDGPLRARLLGEIEEFGLAERIELPGVIDDIASAYRTAEFFVMSSRYESFGLVTAEALTYGLPAIGFADCPGTHELIKPGINGILVDDPDRVGGLAEALAMLMGDPDARARLGAGGPLSVAMLTGNAVVADWEALLRRIATEF